MLQIDQIQVNYGAAPALWEVSLEVKTGELVSVIGPNGAGKTTLINAVMGLNPLKSGKIVWEDETISKLSPHQLCEKGLALVPESRRLFTGMTVRENLELGAMHPAARAVRHRTFEQVCDLFPAVRAKLDQVSGTLSGGQQQMVAVSVGLMGDPKFCIFDEPSLGLAPIVIQQIGETLQKMRALNLTVLLIEQNAMLASHVADRIYIMSAGRVQFHDTPASLMQNPEVIEKFLSA